MSKLTKIKASQITKVNHKQARQTEAELLGMSDSDYRKAVLMTLSAINLVLAQRM